MEKVEIKSIIEALLFTWGEPLEYKEISKILELKLSDTREILDEMVIEYKDSKRGLQILQHNNCYQISTKPNMHKWINQLYVPEKKKGLSNASLETLSIIAYKQPITKSEIDYIRGVKSDKALKSLLEKDVVKEIGRLEKIGKPIVYGTTDYFLQYFGIKTLEELPTIQEIDVEEVKKEIENYV